MAIENLHIGQGIGGAQVFGHNPAIQQYGKMLADRKAKEDNEIKSLSDQLAKGYDPTGLRNDADKREYMKQYANIEQAATDAHYEKDATKKAMSLAKVRKQLADLGSFSEGSKQTGIFEKQLAMSHLKDRYLLDDDSAKQLKDQMNMVWNDPNVRHDPGQFERGVDPQKMDEEYNKANSQLSKHHTATYDSGTIIEGPSFHGDKTATLNKQRVIPFNDVLEYHMHRAEANPDYKKYLHDQYKNIIDPNEKKQLAMRVSQDIQDHGHGQGLIENKEENLVHHPNYGIINYNYRLEHPASGVPPGAYTPVQQLITDMQKGVPGSGEKLIGQTSKGQYGDKQASIGIDPNTGHHVFTFPPQIDIKNKAHNDELRKQWKEKNPGEPYDPTVKGYALKPEIKKPAERYDIDPNTPDYPIRVSQMSASQNINLSNINKTESLKGGRGQIKEAKLPGETTPQSYTIKGKKYHSDYIKKQAAASGMSVEDYIKEVSKR